MKRAKQRAATFADAASPGGKTSTASLRLAGIGVDSALDRLASADSR